MNRLVLFLVAALLAPGSETWAQKNFPTVRIGIEAPAGTNSHYFVTKQLGLFQKHGINIEHLVPRRDGGIAGVVCR
jgi:ABC-type nitrate/sulfonate/bicarbonate transport system substrate-binding protein